jgi:hypothetical protein
MRRYIVEARNADGSLKLDQEQPPTSLIDATEDVIFAPYFAANEEANSASWEDVREWYAAKGWTIRERNW